MVILKQRHVNFRGILSCPRCLAPMLSRTDHDLYCSSKLVGDVAKTTPRVFAFQRALNHGEDKGQINQDVIRETAYLPSIYVRQCFLRNAVRGFGHESLNGSREGTVAT